MFRFCELGDPLFDEQGKIRGDVSYDDLACFLWFFETGEPLPNNTPENRPFIGSRNGVGLYLIYGGDVHDTSLRGKNILTPEVYRSLPPYDGRKLIYCAGTTMESNPDDHDVVFLKRIPRQIIPEYGEIKPRTRGVP